jgi:hypothetical protein
MSDNVELRAEAAATDRRYAERFPGWRRSGAACCPRVVAGKRCRAYAGGPDGCICERYRSGPLDHNRIWRTPEGETVFTTEPYGLDGASFAAFVAECMELGLRVEVAADSPWNPGETVLVMVRREMADAWRRAAAEYRTRTTSDSGKKSG